MERTIEILPEDSSSLPSETPLPYRFFYLGVLDFFRCFKRANILFYMAYADIRRRYRRTMLGPFWATLSLAIFIGSMGGLFSLLWKTPIRTFLPLFASGFVVWSFFSTTVTDACACFTAAEGYIKQIAMPYSFYALLTVCRNFLIFLHQIIIYILVALIFRVPITENTLLIIPGMLLFMLNCTWIAIALGLWCTRFRDIQQVVISGLQVSMFITPIFWPATQLTNSTAVFICVKLNLFYHFIAVVRYPLLGQSPELLSWLVNVMVLVVGWLLTMYYLSRSYNKLVYWL